MSATSDLSNLDVIAVTVFLNDESLAAYKKTFKRVLYHPDGKVPKEEWSKVNVWHTSYMAFPEGVEKLDEIPATKVVQLSSAGANVALKHPIFQDERAQKQITLCSASGIHVYCIPQYVVAQVVNVYMYHHIQFQLMRTGKWPSRADLAKEAHAGEVVGGTNLGSRTLYGKTAGFLGYGHIGRETARLLKAFQVNIIAANSSGQKKADEGYIVPGTGDIDGSIPSAYYSTNDPKSFKEFLSKCDILVASLPSTPQTQWLLTSEHLRALPPRAVFVNVGRGDLVHSDDLLEALDHPTGLGAIALDVTDPEPLPDGHPLFTHPRAIITPHTSGDVEGYFDRAADLVLANIAKIRGGGAPINKIDLEKGY